MLTPIACRTTLAKKEKVVAWDKRARGGQYFSCSRRVGKRVTKEYYGTGPLGELAAELTDRRQAPLAENKRLRKQAEARDQTVLDDVKRFHSICEAVAAASLTLAGYHRTNSGPWRRKRRERDNRSSS